LALNTPPKFFGFQELVKSYFDICVMTALEVQSYVLAEISSEWGRSNTHGVDLRSCIVEPRRILVIWRTVRDGQIAQENREVWLVLEERPTSKDGYKIVFDESRKTFGLASSGFPSDLYPCLCGYYGDFWTTFEGM
jgi:hypothetical protein